MKPFLLEDILIFLHENIVKAFKKSVIPGIKIKVMSNNQEVENNSWKEVENGFSILTLKKI